MFEETDAGKSTLLHLLGLREPTGNLDKETGETILQLLWGQARTRNAATVIVTH